MARRIVFGLLLIAILQSCVDPPVEAPSSDKSPAGPGAIILCEGIWGQENASITRLDYASGRTINNYFYINNQSLLGDIAQDALIIGDTCYVSLFSAGVIRAFRLSTGKECGHILLGSEYGPRYMAYVNDTLAFFSDQKKNAVIGFNPRSLELSGIEIYSGPQPEEIVYHEGFLYTANSAFGDINKNHPEAETIAVIDIDRKERIRLLEADKNVSELEINPYTNRLYAAWYNLPSLVEMDSPGGIIEYSLDNYEIIRSLRCSPASMQIDPEENSLSFISGSFRGVEGVSRIDLNDDDLYPGLIIKNPHKQEIWKSLAINSAGDIYIGNAMDYIADGEILLYRNNKFSHYSDKFASGIIPNKILFFNIGN
ncbi:MAG: YncE family protein [Candidatus Kapaibacterium sp.]